MIAMMSHHPSVILAKARIQRGRVGFPPFMGEMSEGQRGRETHSRELPPLATPFPPQSGGNPSCRFPPYALRRGDGDASTPPPRASPANIASLVRVPLRKRRGWGLPSPLWIPAFAGMTCNPPFVERKGARGMLISPFAERFIGQVTLKMLDKRCEHRYDSATANRTCRNEFSNHDTSRVSCSKE